MKKYFLEDSEFLKRVKEDVAINTKNIENEISKMPLLRDYYTKLFIKYKTKFIEKQIEITRKYASLYIHYNEQYELELKVSEIPDYIKADKGYQELEDEFNKLKADFEFIEKTLANINSKGWDIKNLVEYQKVIYNKGMNPAYD